MDGPDDAKRRARRELEFQEQMRAHGGTGSPPDIDLSDPRAVEEAILEGQCLWCSGRWDALHTHVWKHYEMQLLVQGIDKKLLMARGIQAFRQQFNYYGPIDSDRHREGLRQAQLTRMRGQNGRRIRANLAKKSSGPRPERYGKSGANPSGWNPSNWDIAKCLVSGMGHVETAKKLGGIKKTSDENLERMQRLVGRRAESMDLARDATFICNYGELFYNGRLFQLRKISGFESADFDKCTGLGEGRSQATRPDDSIANPLDAGKVVAWCHGVIRELLKISANHTTV